MSRKTGLTELHKKGKGEKIPYSYYAEFLRKLAISYRMMGDLEMASFFKRMAQKLER